MGQYLVVGEHRAGGTGGIYAQRVTGEGYLDGSGIGISAGGTLDRINPAVAGSESAGQYLVVWTEEYLSGILVFTGIAGRAISTGGALLGGETALGGLYTDHGAVASGPLGDFLVAFDDTGNGRDVYGSLWGHRVYMPLVLR